MTWDFYANNKDAIDAIAAIIGALSVVGGAVWAGLKLWHSKHIRGEVNNVFEIIADKENFLAKLLRSVNNDSPFADHKIPYQPRISGENLQAELKTELNASRYLLITAPTGYGKTREAGMLAKKMMEDGWQVIRVLDTGWLDVPKNSLTSGRVKVLLLLDDLNNLFRKARGLQDPKAETSQIPTFKAPSYYTRLLAVLNWFEERHDPDDFCVLATARDEEEYLQALEYNENDKLWKRFTRVKIKEPSIPTVVDMLQKAKAEGLKGLESDFETIARRNDRSIRNLVLNLQRWHRENKAIAADNFLESQGKSWSEKFTEVEKKLKDQPVKFFYLAVFLLRYFQVPLVPHFVISLAGRLAYPAAWERFTRRRHTRKTFNYLTQKENLLTPPDGKLEGCPLVQNADPQAYLEKVLETLLFNGYFYTQEISFAVLRFIDFVNQDQKQKKMRSSLLFVVLLFLHFPNELRALLLGKNPKHRSKAIKILTKKRKKNILTSLFLSELHSKQGASAESIALLEKEIKDNPQAGTLYNELGMAYKKAGRYEEAEASYRKAIELNPSYATAYSNLGILLKNLKRYDEAEASYRKAIELNPSDATAYNNLAILLRTISREKEALPLLGKMMEIAPEDFNSYLGVASIKRGLGETIESELVEKARALMPADDFYNRACLESVCANADLAFEYLQKAAQKERFNPAWAWKDPDLQWIRSDPRFEQMVGKKPS